jgi:hypothetical protein
VIVCTDLDGSIEADPPAFQHIFQALRAAGDQVAILTGVKGAKSIGPADVQAKQDYIAQLGFTAYDQLVVFPDNGQLDELKANWCQANGAGLLIDNSKSNARAAAACCLVLVPWATRTK